MAYNEKFTAEILLNSKEAENHVKELEKSLGVLKRKRDDALVKGDITVFKNASKEIDRLSKKLDKENILLRGINRTLGDMSNAKVKELQALITRINKELNSPHIARGSKEWEALTRTMRRAKTELHQIGDAVGAQQSLWKRFFVFLNTNWGAFTQILGAATGLTMAMRSSVKEYATIEEAMADTRKYTGLADEAVRDLNEDLKKMDTRTSREKLNELAGAAGRLGKDSKKDILEFVEAGNMIQVSLGDDLGDGAIDKVGKLAMAFGEDRKKGLRGAMLATGSAINELAQNSSAQAGYLVDFTARVAGFGKQLGLTQAQIMGFGAVMDENMLRDEMAATAFGNMLTKMQTDTDKFARIAGMNMREFTDLLNKDANAAILALADSLKKADPQLMMKMLDDMGLDGSRAVGVLSTLADKVDDVRQRQELATKAYQEGTSVQKEYATMNDTVEAKIEKNKKRFHELSVELGEKLMPIVKYTISTGSMAIKMLNVLADFVTRNWKELLVLGGVLTGLNILWKAHTIAVKADNVVTAVSNGLHKTQVIVMANLRQALMAARIAVASLSGNQTRLNWLLSEQKRLLMTNPWTALATVLVTVGVAVWGASKAWRAHREELRNNLQEIKNLRAQQKLQKDLNKKVDESIAEQKTKVEQLSRVIRSNAYTINERRKAIKSLQGIIPGYHASISKEGALYNENSKAIKTYIEELNNAAMAEAVYTKKVEINGKRLDLTRREQRINGSLKAVQAYRDTHQQEETEKWTDRDGREHTSKKKTAAAIEGDRQQKIHEQRLKDVKSEQAVLDAEDKFLDKMLKKNEKLNKLYANHVTKSNTVTSPATTGTTASYVSDNDRRKQEAEQKKQAAAEEKARREHLQKLKEADRAEKGAMDERLANNILLYSAGEQDYRQYIANQQKITEDGLRARMAVWDKESAEYKKYMLQLAALQKNGDDEMTRQRQADLERAHIVLMDQLEKDFNTEGSAIYHNEQAYNEARFQEEMAYLEDRRELTREGSLERMQVEWEIEDRNRRHQLENQLYFQQLLNDVKSNYLNMGDREREAAELNNLDVLYERKLLKEEEYQRARMAIKAQYTDGKTGGEQVREDGANALKVAEGNAGKNASGIADVPIVGTVAAYSSTMMQLEELYKKDEISHETYLEAKRQATAQFCQDLGGQMQAAFGGINQIMSAASSYYGAQSDLEVAMTKKKYDKEIAAAGNNQRKVKKLQEKQAKEEAAIKTKYNRKQVKIQIAQALAQTATNALNAYGSAAAIPVVGTVLAPIAAAMAVAAGMIQVATIKKQAQAQEAGYYEGGFTGGRRYRKEAGVVHEGEFVASHQAVNNPNVLPVLQFLDQAQRNNTVAGLTAEDISQQLGQGGSAVVTPIVNVTTDNRDLREGIANMNEAVEALNDILANGIDTMFDMDKFEKNWNHHQKMKKR